MPKPSYSGLNINLSEDEVSQEIDLKPLLGEAANDPVVQQEASQALLDFMLERIEQKNQGIGGKKLKSPYAKSYEESQSFAAFGKSSSDINMKLSGDMIGSMDVLETGDTVKIGIQDSLQAAKAYGHITGFEGHPNEDKMKKYQREFFGLSKKEQEAALKEISDEVKRNPESFGIGVTAADVLRGAISDQAILSLARRLLG